MKHIIILGDGMADHHVGRLGGKTCCNMLKLLTWIHWHVREEQGSL